MGWRFEGVRTEKWELEGAVRTENWMLEAWKPGRWLKQRNGSWKVKLEQRNGIRFEKTGVRAWGCYLMQRG